LAEDDLHNMIDRIKHNLPTDMDQVSQIQPLPFNIAAAAW
jgi:hypothetical protein